MRPTSLRVKGLRSYHTDRTILLDSVDLLAVIGDTGAGKSSLLEAITFALYAASTWDRRNVKELISDRCQTMTVQLEFRAAGDDWRVTRTISRKTTPPPSHELVCLSNPELPRVDTPAEVNARIQSLVGLKYEAFCSAVLLPQGKFEKLLKAPNARRVDILKNIVGLEQVADLKKPVSDLAAELEAKLLAVYERRSAFSTDPADEHSKARAHIARLKPKIAALESADTTIGEHERTASEQQARVGIYRGRAEALEAQLTGRYDELSELAAKAGEYRIRRDPLAEEITQLETQISQADQVVANDAIAGRSAAQVAEAKAIVVGAAGTLRQFDRDAQELAQTRERLAESQTSHERAGEDLETELAHNREARTAANEVADAAKEARKGATNAGTALRQLGDAVTALCVAEDALAKHEEAITKLNSDHELFEAAAKTARTKRASADRDVRELARRAEGAALAIRCRPGSPCPVCQQVLPDDFVAPAVEGLEQAESKLKGAQDTESEANRLAAAKSGEVANATATKPEKVEAVSRASGERDAALGAVTALLVIPDDAEPAELEEYVRRHARALDTEATRRERDAETAAAHVDGLVAEFQKSYTAHEAERAGLEEREKAAGRERTRIAEGRADVAASLTEQTWPVTLQNPPTAEVLDTVIDDLEKLASVAREREELREKLRSRQKKVAALLTALDDEINDNVRERVIAIRATITTLADELKRVAGIDPPDVPTADEPIRELAMWAKQIEAAASREARLLRDQSKEAAKQAQVEEGAIGAILSDLGYTTRSALQVRLQDLKAQVLGAERERDRAQAQLEPVAQLNDLGFRLKSSAEALRDLAHLLGDSKFISFAVQRRERDLLIHASQTLHEVTGGRFGFAEKFNIVDNETGLARSPETLSGGETFLASLALALGLVELTARGGATLDALFLDEGFGSLDPNTLDGALDALERRANTGRLIALISHVPTVAERIENVLQVTYTQDGSDAKLLSAAERSRLAEGDALARLAI